MSQKKTTLARCDQCGLEGKFHYQSGTWFCECGAIYKSPLIWSGDHACPNYGAKCKYCKEECIEAGSEVIFSIFSQ